MSTSGLPISQEMTELELSPRRSSTYSVAKVHNTYFSTVTRGENAQLD